MGFFRQFSSRVAEGRAVAGDVATQRQLLHSYNSVARLMYSTDPETTLVACKNCSVNEFQEDPPDKRFLFLVPIIALAQKT